jgi:hypothetical protein
MQTFHRANRTTTLDWFVDLLIERLPIIEWLNAEKLQKGIEFFDVVLPGIHANITKGCIKRRTDSQRRARQAPSIFALQSATCLSGLCVAIFDVVRLV